MATFSNQATLSYSGGTASSNVVTGNLVEVLSASKTAVTADYSENDKVTYAVSIVNTGGTAFTNLTLTDDLGKYTTADSVEVVPLTYTADSVKYYINGTLQTTALTVSSGQALTISGIDVPANGNALIVYETSVNEYAPLDTSDSITNTASVSGTGVSSTVTASETVTAEAAARLSIEKAISPSTVSENGQLTYTFTIKNSGNTAAVATDDIVITDTFNPILDITSVSLDGTAWTSPTNYTYDSSTGLFQTVAGQITVPKASYTQDTTSGAVTISPGTSTLVVTGTI